VAPVLPWPGGAGKLEDRKRLGYMHECGGDQKKKKRGGEKKERRRKGF